MPRRSGVLSVIIRVFIEPHERFEALDAYRDRLKPAQVSEIEDAPETALISLVIDSNEGTTVTVIEEG